MRKLNPHTQSTHSQKHKKTNSVLRKIHCKSHTQIATDSTTPRLWRLSRHNRALELRRERNTSTTSREIKKKRGSYVRKKMIREEMKKGGNEGNK